MTDATFYHNNKVNDIMLYNNGFCFLAVILARLLQDPFISYLILGLTLWVLLLTILYV